MIVNLKKVTCSKAGCSNQFWIDELWQGLYWCSEECSRLELEDAPTIAAADAAVVAIDVECPNAGLSLEGGTDAIDTATPVVVGVSNGGGSVSNGCTGGQGMVG